MTSISIVAYLVLFATVGFLFLFAALLLGRFLRARAPSAEKLQTYECGEPPVGSSYVQFDLRFYVVALVFIIFEVEVAFFFPWATVFGQATALMGSSRPVVAAGQPGAIDQGELAHWMTRQRPAPAVERPDPQLVRADARRLALASMVDIGVFFGVLLVGFAYVWWRGDLNWVRAFGPGD